jgi:hypothetical protein
MMMTKRVSGETAAQSAEKELARPSTVGSHWFCLSAVRYGRF